MTSSVLASCENLKKNYNPSANHKSKVSPYHERPILCTAAVNKSDSTSAVVNTTSGNVTPPGFRYIRSLGRGSYGRVELCQNTATDAFVAIKYINKSFLCTHRQLNRVRREVRILTLLEHPHIIQLKGVIETPESILMVLEYVPHGELFEFISARGHLTNMEALVVFRQLLSAVAYCHANCIIHRDLKPENILLGRDLSVKVADFGFGAVFGHIPLLSTFCGSPHYAAPEMLSGTPYCGPEVDIWSLGVILFVMLTGKLPTHDSSPHSLRETPSFPLVVSATEASLCSSSADLLRRILVSGSSNRATLAEILAHPWVRSVDIDLPYSFIPYREPISEKNLNTEIVSYLCQSGYDEENIRRILIQKEPHPLKAEYYLLMERDTPKILLSSSKTHSSPKKAHQLISMPSSPPMIHNRRYSLESSFSAGTRDRSVSPVRRLLTRVSSFFTSSPSRQTPTESIFKPLVEASSSTRERRSSMPGLPVYMPVPEPSSVAADVLHNPRKVMEGNSSSIITLHSLKVPEISFAVTSFLNKMGMIFSARDPRNPFKLWCENRQTGHGEFPLLALTVEVVEICFGHRERGAPPPSLFGLECRRICGGSWVVFRRMMTLLNRHISELYEEPQLPDA
ncbi:hypothetical protein MDAP_002155 [Mitosporidium daphniae]|uniref:Protein kinase domain-containing protein n=1 Tax=Mitosporidium daphniae TaxID=1485682 RepID=A0A098VP66_9MICR|nr:uncharacterized protein DI09_54p100 [Mitosporidium daphniae]KGG50818.1 hypothetical protein DI09_54p100 [Mitosporidium daphniae]|eukprot:XP_013237245.1 uncharacterized protein DI09_54p100 [Mitosporidium daphniae]